jgi:hypothetical protein
MKLASFALLLMASMAFVLAGCSDNSSQPVSSTDQSASVPVPLGKVVISEFTSTAGPDLSDPDHLVINPGFEKTPDGKMIARGAVERSLFNATFGPGVTDLVSGNGVLEMNFTADPLSGEMFGWGKLTVKPGAPEAQGGVWEITWNGKGSLTELGWVVPLKMIGHGNGGALTGMQLSGDLTITLWGLPDGWMGTGNGVIKSH